MRRALIVCVLFACHHPASEKPAPPKTQKTVKRAHEPMVYVDGAARASLTRAELPTIEPVSLCRYLAAVGVECSQLHALHLYREGGQVVAADPARLSLAFDDGGHPLLEGAPVEDVALYVEKTPPEFPVHGIPYLDEPVRGGTRLNVDGRLRARIKRNQLPEISDDDDALYRLSDFLQTLHVGAPRAVELVSAEDGVVRVPEGELAQLGFSAERQRHGQMKFRFGARSISAVAVNVYVVTTPPSRDLPLALPVAARAASFSGGCEVVVGRPGW